MNERVNRFDDVFQRVIGHEGGYVNDPNDPGGETKFGISKRSYPKLTIAALTIDDAKTIYRTDYWAKVMADELPVPIDEYVFDFAVNSGVQTASNALQGAVGALRDGSIGPKTIEAVKRTPVRNILRLLFVERAMVFALSPKDNLYGRGWFARLFDKTELALRELA